MGALVCAAEQNVNPLGVRDVTLNATLNSEITAGRRETWLKLEVGAQVQYTFSPIDATKAATLGL